ncbi:MAG: hypothetical protein ACKO9H_16635, partial [Planctomycetota bacterium]
MRFKTNVARSISRVVAEVTSASEKALVEASIPPAESGNFPLAAPVAAPSLAAGNAHPWLKKVAERFPVEQLNQRLAQLSGEQKAERQREETGQSAAVGDELDRAISQLAREL